MDALRFLQISDVHFGAPLIGGRLALGREAARKRNQERREAFARGFALVRERDLDGVLVPGDLFDDESIDTDTLRFVTHTMAEIAPKPVFIAPGNHDPYGGASPYRVANQEDARGVRWPDNVELFAHAQPGTVSWPGRDGVFVTGFGVAVNEPDSTRKMATSIPRDGEGTHILLFHGSRDDGGFLQSEKATHPFSRPELLAQRFDWVALGHYHGLDVISDDGGRARAAYAGCSFAGGLDEQGAKGALIVELNGSFTRTEHVALDHRQVREVRVDFTGVGFLEQARERIEWACGESGVRPEDLVLLRIEGRRAQGLDTRFLEEFRGRFFHLRVDASGLRADVDLDRYPDFESATTTEERFVAHLRDHAPADHPAERVHRALLYGLDALERGQIELHYED